MTNPGHASGTIGMKARAMTVFTALAAAAATAQQTATYSFVFTSPGAQGGTNGTVNIEVLPGSVVTAVVRVTISPGIGAPVGTPHGTLTGTILGLSAGAFNITGAGTTGAGSGWSAPSLIAPYNSPLGTNPGTPAGQSHAGVIWGMGFLLTSVHPLPENPAKVWTGTYTAGAAGIVNLTFTGLATTTAWAFPPGGTFPFEGNFASNGGVGGSISVVPAPASLALLGLGGLVALRRRR